MNTLNSRDRLIVFGIKISKPLFSLSRTISSKRFDSWPLNVTKYLVLLFAISFPEEEDAKFHCNCVDLSLQTKFSKFMPRQNSEKIC